MTGARFNLLRTALLLLAPSTLLTVAGVRLVLNIAVSSGPLPLPFATAFVGLLSIGLFYNCISKWPVVLGAGLRLFARPHDHLPPAPSRASRLAILFPVRDENPARVCAAIAAMAPGLAAAGIGPHRFFVLSDTAAPDIVAAEAGAVAALAAAGVPVTHRHRPVNSGRKVGNIEEFCRRWGDGFDHMLVLDADSLMGAATVAGLMGLMEARPDVALVQVEAHAVDSATPFGRWGQFAMRFHTPLWTLGAACWQGDAGNYWGHNALIRIAPFVAHCRLPVLPGRPPLGGEILSHDVVEAGLLRRAGWGILLWPHPVESYQQTPTNLVSSLRRERRWCQGNLQHIRLLATPGLHAPNRVHLLTGILYYLSAPCWLALGLSPLCLPSPQRHAAWAAILTLSTIAAMLPGLLCLAFEWPARRAAVWGGRGRLAASFLLDRILALALAPAQTLFCTGFVLSILAGRDSGWAAQARGDQAMGWREAWRGLRPLALAGGGSMALAIACGGGAYAPALAGTVLAWPFAVWSSRPEAGDVLRGLGLFLTEDETRPSAILRDWRTRLVEATAAPSRCPPAAPPSLPG